ncbi:MAG: anthranilate synthase component I family protein [Bacteroidia bacterium]|nr:anthranilate synthase component I family protein [Bacteroidia bacterium]
MQVIDLLHFAQHEPYFMLCQHGPQQYTAGLGLYDCISSEAGWEKVDAFIEQYKGYYIFSHICYDVKNDFEKLVSENESISGFSDAFFWVPAVTIVSAGNNYHFAPGMEHYLNKIQQAPLLPVENAITWNNNNHPYTATFTALQKHLQAGNIYEINYCLPFTANGIINTVTTYKKLYELTQAPMACYYRNKQQFLLCGSPERFLKKTGRKLLSQPIKGTAERATDSATDMALKQALLLNEKERSENIMIVDLVRNDLSRIALTGSVKVNELCGAYTFKTVHHLISTIECQIPEMPFSQILAATFPMGSMTGAPKIKAMQLIEQYESAKRGLFSGAVGFFEPNGNFDFNVVIRSILFDASQNKIATWAGSAITISAQAQAEYEECLLKLKAIKATLSA